MTIKYYIGQLNIRHGEYEFTKTFKFFTDAEPNEYMDMQAKTWYGERDDDEEDAYFFDCGNICTTVDGYQEITQEIYEALKIIVEIIEI